VEREIQECKRRSARARAHRQHATRRSACRPSLLRSMAPIRRQPPPHTQMIPSSQHRPTCSPVSTEGWTRRVHFVREGGGDELSPTITPRSAPPQPPPPSSYQVDTPRPSPRTNWTRRVPHQPRPPQQRPPPPGRPPPPRRPAAAPPPRQRRAAPWRPPAPPARPAASGPPQRPPARSLARDRGHVTGGT